MLPINKETAKSLILVFGIIAGILLLPLVMSQVNWFVRANSTHKYETQYAHWNSENVNSYQVIADYVGDDYRMIICQSALLNVRDGEVVSITASQADGRWAGFEDQCQRMFKEFTIEGVFNLAEQYIILRDPLTIVSIDIEYDEEWGYIKFLDIAVGNTYLTWIIPTRRVESSTFEIRLREFETIDEN